MLNLTNYRYQPMKPAIDATANNRRAISIVFEAKTTKQLSYCQSHQLSHKYYATNRPLFSNKFTRTLLGTTALNVYLLLTIHPTHAASLLYLLFSTLQHGHIVCGTGEQFQAKHRCVRAGSMCDFKNRFNGRWG